MNVTGIPSAPSSSSASSTSCKPATSFDESDRLRQRIQAIAFRQRKAAIEQRIEAERERRIAEWSTVAAQYMATEQRLAQMCQLAQQQVRSDHLLTMLTAAQFEMQRSVQTLRDTDATLRQLSGTNISRESMQKFQSKTARMAHLADTIALLIDGGQHFNQAPVVREFKQLITRLAQNLDEADASVKYLSEKTITVSSDVLMAKSLKPATEEADDVEHSDSRRQ